MSFLKLFVSHHQGVETCENRKVISNFNGV